MRRNTAQHTLILETLRLSLPHATADEIYAEVIKANPHISRATVYRNLNKLCEEGFARKRYIPGEAERYDPNCTNHYHVKCLGCGKIFDVDMDYIPKLQQFLKDDRSFQIVEHDIVFRGYCKDCQNAALNPKSSL